LAVKINCFAIEKKLKLSELTRLRKCYSKNTPGVFTLTTINYKKKANSYSMRTILGNLATLANIKRKKPINFFPIKLIAAFNLSAVTNFMCRNKNSVSWDAYLYDFNQMRDLKGSFTNSPHVLNFKLEDLRNRNILLKQRFYGCNGGAGPSCGGAVLNGNE